LRTRNCIHPFSALIGEYIVGLKSYAEKLQQAAKTPAADGYLDLMQFPLEGVQVVDSHTYRIKLKGKYPQFVYWLAMPFFSPVPWEAERFYSQPGMSEGKNLSLDWYPVGTGAYMLTLERSEPDDGHGAQSELRRRALPVGRRGRRQGSGIARRRRENDAFYRSGGVQPREGEHSLLEQIPAGLLRRIGHHVRQFRPDRADYRQRRHYPRGTKCANRISGCRLRWRRR
jgi:hypothetical protein